MAIIFHGSFFMLLKKEIWFIVVHVLYNHKEIHMKKKMELEVESLFSQPAPEKQEKK